MSRLASRRDLLRGSAVTALAGVAASVPALATSHAPADPDAVLLALCADHARASLIMSAHPDAELHTVRGQLTETQAEWQHFYDAILDLGPSQPIAALLH